VKRQIHLPQVRPTKGDEGDSSTQLPSLDVKRPSAEGEMSSLDAKRPSAEGETSSLDVKRPSAEGELPSLDVKRPSAEGELSSLDDLLQKVNERTIRRFTQIYADKTSMCVDLRHLRMVFWFSSLGWDRVSSLPVRR
jgi:hypothetical protein